jgi:predicted flap endonuclease-1-like 5' DNA nuclease
MKIEEVEGIGPAFGEKLRAAGISHTDTLLEAACTKPARKELAEKTGISPAKLLEWANVIDLCRVSGIGPEFAELLEPLSSARPCRASAARC